MASLSVHDLNAFYGKAHVLHDVNITVESGITGILGRNGAGKTSLLKSIMQLDISRTGAVSVLGKDTQRLATDEIARLGVAYMQQGDRVFPRLTVLENIQVAAHVVTSPKPIHEILEIIPELQPLLKQLAGTLSGGQQQMVGIARALSMRCKLLLMDEPTEGLMPRLVIQVGEIIKRLSTECVTVILVEQNVNLAMRTCDFIYIIENGQIRAKGDTQSVASGGDLERYLGVNVLAS